MKSTKTAVPSAMKVQLARLFGKQSKMATASMRSDAEWRRDLQRALVEVWNYFDANVETDPVHRRMLESGFDAAERGLQEEHFWASYCEGITRVLLCLLGNYPDHRKRKAGAKQDSHYQLKMDRSLTFIQTNEQKQHLLLWTAGGVLELRGDPMDAIHEFRSEVGMEVPIAEFLNWYKLKYPENYLKVF